MNVRYAAAVFAVVYLCGCGGSAPRYSGTVQTESVTIGSMTGGRVVDVAVSTGMRVRRGQLIVQLDDAQLHADLAQAQAQAAQARANLAALERGNVATEVARSRDTANAAQAQYRQALASTTTERSAQADAVRDAQAAARLARVTYDRTRALAQTGDVSQQALDNARAQYLQAKARADQARAQYATVVNAQLPGQVEIARSNAAAAQAGYATSRNGPRPEEIDQGRAAVHAADAAIARAQSRLREATITSPADGVVASLNLHRGDLLTANQPAAIIDTFADPYVYIYASQSDLSRFTNGARVRLASDAGMGTFDGVVESHDRTAQFTPVNTETADQRAELVYGVKIRIHDAEHKLLDGTTVTVDRR